MLVFLEWVYMHDGSSEPLSSCKTWIVAIATVAIATVTIATLSICHSQQACM